MEEKKKQSRKEGCMQNQITTSKLIKCLLVFKWDSGSINKDPSKTKLDMHPNLW